MSEHESAMSPAEAWRQFKQLAERANTAEAELEASRAECISLRGERDRLADENDGLRRSLAEDATEIEDIRRLLFKEQGEREDWRCRFVAAEHHHKEAMRRAADAMDAVQGAHAESARLRGYAAGWLYIVEDALERPADGQERALRLLRDQLRRALAGQQALIAEARAGAVPDPPPDLTCPPDGCGAYECHENGCKREATDAG